MSLITKDQLLHLRKLLDASTRVVGWYPYHAGDGYHPDRASVRGPFGRWFIVQGGDNGMGDKHPTPVASLNDDADFAAAAMNSLGTLLDRVEELTAEGESLCNQNAILLVEKHAMQKHIQELESALNWYASEAPYRNDECDRLNADGGFFTYGADDWAIALDLGSRARQALASQEPTPGVPQRAVTSVPARVVHLAPYMVRLFDNWVCGTFAFSHERGTHDRSEVTCPECLATPEPSEGSPSDGTTALPLEVVKEVAAAMSALFVGPGSFRCDAACLEALASAYRKLQPYLPTAQDGRRSEGENR